jgi:hypothetical protein
VYPNRIIALLFLITAACLPPPVPAAVIQTLYEAEVPVDGQTPQERTDAVRAALTQVLIKVTGNREISSDPRVQDLLDNGEKYVQQYRYRQVHDEPVAGIPESGVHQALWVHFDSTGITGYLSGKLIPVWGKTRSATLLWLAVDQGDQRYIVAGDKADDLQRVITRQAAQRGVRVFLPLFDLEDQLNLSFADVWGNFEQSITKASQRYKPDAVLVGRVYQPQPGVWQGRWTLYEGRDSRNWEAEGADINEVVAQGVDGLADTLAEQFAQVISETVQDSAVLEVTDVANIDDYARVVKYLQGLESVAQIQVQRVAGDDLYLRLSLLSDQTGLVQHIALGTTLQPTPPDAGTPPSPGENVLVYRLLP